MGGEWYFHYKANTGVSTSAQASGSVSESTGSLDVTKYQELLLKLKTQFENQYNAEYVQWSDVKALPPPDNVFARFKFTCGTNRHKHWMIDEPEHPWFNLYWVPVAEIEMQGSLHDRRGIDYRDGGALFNIQRTIVETFPDHFVLYRDWIDSRQYDSEKGPWIIDYESYYSQGSPIKDFAACDKDVCGYCGHCPY